MRRAFIHLSRPRNETHEKNKKVVRTRAKDKMKLEIIWLSRESSADDAAISASSEMSVWGVVKASHAARARPS